MAEISTTVANANLRTSIIKQIQEWASATFDTDALMVANSEFTMPMVNEKGEEIFCNISVSIPKGERDSENHTYLPYDGYAAADDYKADLAKKADAERVKAEAAALKEKAKKRGRKPKKEPAE